MDYFRWSECLRVPHENMLLCVDSYLIKSRQVMATGTWAGCSAVPVISKTLTVEFQTLWFTTVAWFMSSWTCVYRCKALIQHLSCLRVKTCGNLRVQRSVIKICIVMPVIFGYRFVNLFICLITIWRVSLFNFFENLLGCQSFHHSGCVRTLVADWELESSRQILIWYPWKDCLRFITGSV